MPVLILFLVGAICAGLKGLGVIPLSWGWALLPIWILLTLMLIVLIYGLWVKLKGGKNEG